MTEHNAKNIVIWGAGRIGRGFIADLFNEAGYPITLVDQSPELVKALNKAGQYTVVRAESTENRKDVLIKEFTALQTAQSTEIEAALIDTDLIAIAVYPKFFEDVAKQLTPYILKRRQQRPNAALDILLCTNLLHAGPKFQSALERALLAQAPGYLESHIGVIETLVIRIAPDAPAELQEQEPLMVWTNGYPELPVDKNAFKGQIPKMDSLRMVENMHAEEMRKMYTYNMSHAVLSYHGYPKGHQLIVECLADPDVAAEATGALAESSQALQAEYGFTEEEMDHWIQGVLTQTNNPALGDTVLRMGGDPSRKLKRSDRLVGPALLAVKHGIQPVHLIRAIAAGLLFDPPNDPGAASVQAKMTELELLEAVQDICGLTQDDEALINAIISAYQQIKLERKWAKLAEKAYQLGFEYEKIYHGCGQSVVAAVTETLDIFSDEVFNAATSLSGGIGQAGDASCSAFTGCTLAFGMLSPRRREHFDGDRENKYRTFAMTQKLRERFIKEYGSITCQKIHEKKYGRAYNLMDKADQKKFDKKGAHGDKGCPVVTGLASKWTIEIIAEEKIKDQLKEI